MATSPDLPLGLPSEVEAPTAKAELQIILFLVPVREAQAETRDKLNCSTSQSGRLTASTGRLGRLALALALAGACIRQ